MNEEYRYFDDEELERLMAKVERDEIISAPTYLKEQIIRSIPVKKTVPANRQLFLYSAKVVAAAAAAILILTVIPAAPFSNFSEVQIKWDAKQKQETEEEPFQNRNGDKIAIFMNEKSAEISTQLNNFSNWLIKEENYND